jgi:hypothetical protein
MALLVLLLGGLVLQTIVATSGSLRVAHDGVGTVVAIAIFAAVFRHGGMRGLALALLVAMLAVGWSRIVAPASLNHPLSIAFHATGAAFYWIAVVQILRDLFGTRVAGAENVRGAVCGYLIAGAAWSAVNALTWLLVPTAYQLDPKVVPLTLDSSGRSALFSYYSFTQLLTLGYSDVTPVGAPATTWSLLAALFGVFYTAVVVSQLVGMAGANRTGP